MAQTLPPAPGSSPLPRYERKRAVGGAKAPRPRFQAADGVLAVIFCAMLLAARTMAAHSSLSPTAWLLALSAGLTYLLGWRCGGRLCGVVAGSLTAFSLSFATTTASWEAAVFGPLTLAALFAFACDALPLGCALAGLAVALRPDGALLGLLLLALAGAHSKRQILPCLGAFLVTTLASLSTRFFLLHLPFAAVHVGIVPNSFAWLTASTQSLTLWLLIPLCAELTDPVRRPRWLPTAIWGIVLFAATLIVHFGSANLAALPLMPVVFVLAAGGLARLMPMLAGEVPAARYGLATLAVLGLLGLRAHTEWPQTPPTITSATTTNSPLPSTSLQTAPLPEPAIAPSTLPGHTSKILLPGVARSALAGRALLIQPLPKPIAKPSVPQFVLHDGRMVRRSKWAVQWDLTHPKTVPLP